MISVLDSLLVSKDPANICQACPHVKVCKVVAVARGMGIVVNKCDIWSPWAGWESDHVRVFADGCKCCWKCLVCGAMGGSGHGGSGGTIWIETRSLVVGKVSECPGPGGKKDG